MKRTGSMLLAASAAFVIAAAGCGDKDPAPAGTGGAGGAASGGSSGGGGTSGQGGTTDPDAAPGTGGSVGGDTGMPVGSDYLPFKVGNTWTYEVTQPGKPTEIKIHKITTMEPVGGTGPFKDTVAYRVESHRMTGATYSDATLSWQNRDGTRVVRYRETSCVGSTVVVTDGVVTKCTVNEEDLWMPARVVIDEMPTGMAYATGLKWVETYAESAITTNFKVNPPVTATTNTSQSDTWEVVNPDASITTPAGSFTGCVVLKKTSMKSVPKQYTYCKGVGKVKEEGTGQTETLTAFTVM